MYCRCRRVEQEWVERGVNRVLGDVDEEEREHAGLGLADGTVRRPRREVERVDVLWKDERTRAVQVMREDCPATLLRLANLGCYLSV